MSRASSLLRLQDIDQSIDRVQERLTAIELVLQGSSLVLERRAELSEREAHLRATEAASRSAEDMVDLQRQKIEQTEGSLYGGSVQNPKELQDLQMEAEALKRHLGTLEDRLLDAMLEAEEAELRRASAGETLVRAEGVVAEEHFQLNQERSLLLADLSRLQAEREASLGSVDQSDIALYGELRQGMGSVVVARVQDGSCGVCGLILPASASQAIRNANELVRCPQCRRFLYAG
jgi:predicted  nucleic acid-binding Zn-ribbon protein